ncbi:MAG: winged helix-turn-helix domain-containing protein, partial [Methanosarcinales archaeon]
MPAPKRIYESRYKPWIELQGKAIVGEGRADLLRAIRDLSSIAKAAKKLDVPYRTAWAQLKRIE